MGHELQQRRNGAQVPLIAEDEPLMSVYARLEVEVRRLVQLLEAHDNLRSPRLRTEAKAKRKTVQAILNNLKNRREQCKAM